MSSYYKISNFKKYPELYVSKKMTAAIKADGLIEPLLLESETVIHEISLERFEAFRREVEKLGDAGTPYIIGVLLSGLSDEDLKSEGLVRSELI